MKVLLIKDVYKLGRAGEIKKVADGYGRNYLIPQKLAVPATAGSLKLAESISKKATERRAVLNKELSSIAEVIGNIVLEFSVKAGETGKLYGSVNNQMVADEIKAKHNLELERHQIVMEPIRNVGEYRVPVQLTIDLIPEVSILVKREGEAAKRSSFQPAVESKPEQSVKVDSLEAQLEGEAVSEVDEDQLPDQAVEEL